ncbi:MAG: hypothetical protein V3R86_02220 [Candidatus Hydrothermarchaeaceae archaeon]
MLWIYNVFAGLGCPVTLTPIAFGCDFVGLQLPDFGLLSDAVAAFSQELDDAVVP